MNDSSASGPLHKVCIGAVLIIISNIIYIMVNYVVSWTKLNAGEVDLIRGFMQIVIFGGIILLNKLRKKTENNVTISLFQWSMMGLYGVLISSVNLTALAAIPLMPIGDLIVLCFTSPVFSVIFEFLILRRPLKIYSVILCVLIIVGDVLVVRPSFLFASEDENEVIDEDLNHPTLLLTNETITNQNDTEPSLTEEELKNNGHYYIGVGLCLYAAAAVSVANVINVSVIKSNESITTSHLVTMSGIFSVVLSLISTFFMANRLVTDPASLSLRAAIALPITSVMTLLAFWFITIAVTMTQHPTLVSMLRSTEIIISLVTESIWWGHSPHYLSIIGSLLVMFCVVTMTGAESLKEKFSKFIRKKDKDEMEMKKKKLQV